MRWTRWMIVPVMVMALGASVILSQPQLQAAVRSKGGPSLRVFREIDGAGREAMSGEYFKAGDRLRFVLDLDAEFRVQIIGLEADGNVYPVWPMDGTTVRLSPGHEQVLPGAVALDEALGDETFYLVACQPDVPEPSCISRGPDAPPACKPDCVKKPFVLMKH